jgi:hypothetical protein
MIDLHTSLYSPAVAAAEQEIHHEALAAAACAAGQMMDMCTAVGEV